MLNETATLPRATTDARAAFRAWVAVVVGSAAVLTTVDAVLLQLKRSYFTGGFLAVDYLHTFTDSLLFLASSFVGDAAAIGIMAAVAFAVGRALRLTLAGSVVLGALVPLLCFGIADVLSYQLLSHLGDAFDLSLMFDLTGRSTAELWAVSAKKLALPASALLGLGLCVGLVVRGVNRRGARAGAEQARFGLKRIMRGAFGLLVVGAIVTTAARLWSAELDNGLKRKPTTRALGAIVNAASDVDRDGYGVLSAPGDPAPANARVFPHAIDVPGNGIDEDGVAGDLPAAYARYAESNPSFAAWPSRPDVVLVVLESFRADAVGASLGGRAVTPVLDELAARGLRVDAAYSHNGYTAQSRHHLMTGSLASLRGGTSLIDDFKAQGYEVGYFSGQDDSFGGSETAVGAERADTMFDARQAKGERYSTFSTPGSLAIPASSVTTRVRRFLDGRRPDRPLFLYVNFHDTHYPYQHKGMPLAFAATPLGEAAIVPDRREELRATYYNAAAYVDSAIGQVLAHVQHTTGRRPAAIVIGDHGESLFDDTFLGHGYALNETQTRIPLIAADIALDLATPFGQSDLRDAVVRALASEAPQGAPVARPVADKRVFQYLGLIDRPREIALTGNDGRLAYDFRSRKVCVDANCMPVGRLDAAQQSRLVDLVHRWEAMILARSEGASQDR